MLPQVNGRCASSGNLFKYKIYVNTKKHYQKYNKRTTNNSLLTAYAPIKQAAFNRFCSSIEVQWTIFFLACSAELSLRFSFWQNRYSIQIVSGPKSLKKFSYTKSSSMVKQCVLEVLRGFTSVLNATKYSRSDVHKKLRSLSVAKQVDVKNM